MNEKTKKITPEMPRKISSKVIMEHGTDKKAKEVILKIVQSDEKVSHALYEVYGACVGYTEGESDQGPWIALKGQFKAIRISDGQVFLSSKVFLEEGITSLVMVALAGVERGSKVEVAVRVLAKYDPASATFYIYQSQPIGDIEENDPIAAIEARKKEQEKKMLNPASEPTNKAQTPAGKSSKR